jgi:polyphenol oxidase
VSTSRKNRRGSHEEAAASPEAIAAVDALFASIGLEHGRRATRTGTWAGGERIHQRRTSTVNPRSSTKKPRLAPGLIRPAGWEAYPWLRAGFSTREGGSTTAFGNPSDLNLGWNVNDPAETVAANRSHFLKAVASPEPGSKLGELVAIRQFHSPLIRIVGANTAPLITPEGRPVLRGDALITSRSGVLLAILTADCVPVLVADTRRRVVAAFHAGWRGTLARIAAKTIGKMQMHFGTNPADLLAAIGPSIGPCCYEVGTEVATQFLSQFADAPTYFDEFRTGDEPNPIQWLNRMPPGHQPPPKGVLLDLPKANRSQLLAAGLRHKNIHTIDLCTACHGNLLFSYRKQGPASGRLMSIIALRT